MKYHREYEVDPSFIIGDAIKWKPTGNGEFIIATKGGRRFFIKRNMHIRYPSRSLPKPVYDAYKKDADEIQKKQRKLAGLMKGLSYKKEHVVTEEAHFFDSENKFVTVTALIEGGLDESFDYSRISKDDFLCLARGSAELLVALHGCGVVHGDLKEKNFVVTREGGRLTPYLIDFDSSYPVSDVPEPDNIGGTDGYLSPEVIEYYDECDEKLKKNIGYSSDIFTLGIVFHRWWCASFPATERERCTSGDAVLKGERVIYDKKLDDKIGEKKGASIISLVNWMMTKDPASRPASKDVAAVLRDEAAVPREYHIGCDSIPIETEVWELHRGAIEILDEESIASLGVVGLKRINERTGSLGLKYLVAYSDGREERLSADGMCECGLAKRLDAALDTPWPEHGIEYESADVIREKGFQEIRRAQMAYRKRYIVTYVGGKETDRSHEWLLSEGLARLLPAMEVDSDTPWPEHGREYVAEALAALGVARVSRAEIGGEHRYRVEYYELIDGAHKVNERVSVNNMKLMGFIR